ncbi:MAG: protein kinase [Planctomycetes bacterium]|nr:protein kinase [Planctomycetota bacterium]
MQAEIPFDTTDDGLPSSGPTAPLPALSFAGGRYRVLRLLGAGGQKEVYLVHDEVLKRDCALSLLRGEGASPANLPRLKREAQTMARLTHPNIVTVHDLGEDGGRPYVVSEHVPGGDLRDEMARASGPLPLERALALACDVALALGFAHGQGVVHRDVKPENVWLALDGSAKLGDFGLALAAEQSRLTLEGAVLGTAYYVSPEQAQGQPVDARSDLYSLGCLLHEMLVGRPPFEGTTLLDIISQHVHAPPPRLRDSSPQSPEALDRLLQRLLAKHAEERPASAGEVLRELERVQRSLSQPAGAREALPPVAPLDCGSQGSFVGRQEEVSVLKAALERALSGKGTVAFLAGEPGIGKTRLAQELARHARLRGARVLIGRAIEGEGAPSYLPFVEALDTAVAELKTAQLRELLGEATAIVMRLLPQIVGRLSDLGPQPEPQPESQRYLLFQGVASLLKGRAAESGLLLVLEDLHWADRPSLQLLQHVARQVQDSRVLVLATYRDLEVDSRHPLSEVLVNLRREHLSERILLRGLPSGDVRALIAALGERDVPEAFAAAVHRETEGNPFFIEEVVKHLIDERRLRRDSGAPPSETLTLEQLGLPQGVREAIDRRLSRLGEPAQRLLSIASAMTGGIPWDLLAAVCGESEERLLDTLDEVLAAQVLRERRGTARGTYELTHALFRQALYDKLSTPRRARLHRQLGEGIERVFAADLEPHLAELAHHFYQAGPGGEAEKAVDYATRAGDRAARLLAHEEAARHYGRAIEALAWRERAAEPSGRLLELHAKRGTAFARVGMWAEARTELEAALAGLPAERAERRAEILGELLMVCYFLLDIPSLRRYSTEGLSTAESAGRGDLAVSALGWLGWADTSDGEVARGVQRAAGAVARARDLSIAPHTLSSLMHYPLMLYWTGRHGEGLDFALEGTGGARQATDVSTLMFSLPHLGLCLAAAGRYGEAAMAFDEARVLGRKYGVSVFLSRAIGMSVGFHIDLFDLEGAEALAEEARDLARSASFHPPVVSTGIDLLMVHARRQEVSEAEGLLAEVAEAVAKAGGWHRWLWRMRLPLARAEFALARGDAEEALRQASEAAAQGQAMGRGKYRAAGLEARARALLLLGRKKQAIADLRSAVEAARALGDPASFLRPAAALLAAEGDDALRSEARRTAARIAAALPDPDMRRRFESAEPVRGLLR